MHLTEPIAFLVLGDENSLFPQVKMRIENEKNISRKIKLNVCCSTERMLDFLGRVEAGLVKVANNCVVIDGSMQPQLLKEIIFTLKNSAFRSLPFIVFLPQNAEQVKFCYSNYVSAVIPLPADVDTLTETFRKMLDFWITTAKLPPFAIIREENVFLTYIACSKMLVRNFLYF